MRTCSVENRFWAKVEKTEGCWLWTAYRLPTGYGQLRLNGKPVRAHRFSYELHHGPIPKGMHVLHTCDVTLCVNPEHLFLGTHADNMADMVAKGRQGTRQGGRSGSAKLTDVQVLEIRERHAAGGISQRKLAEEYGVSKSLIGDITLRKRLTHIGQEQVDNANGIRS